MNAKVTNATEQASADAAPEQPVADLPAPVGGLAALSEAATGPAAGRTPAIADPTRFEALALGATAAASMPAVWLTAGRPTAWAAVAGMLVAALSALHPRLAAGTFGRGCAVLSAAALLAVSSPELAIVAALWSVVTVAVLTTRLPGDTGWLLTAAGGGMLAMLETVLTLLGDRIGVTSGPSGALLAAAAGTIAAGAVGSAIAHRLALGGTGWTLDAPFEGDRMWSGEGTAIVINPGSPSTDAITGMATRGVLLRGVTKALARVDVIGGRVALFVLDVDRFDAVVHQHGEKRANDVLRHLARRLRAAMPAEDVVARVGPTTFAVLVEGIGPDGCEPMVRRMAALLEEEMLVGAGPVRVSCSVGTAIADAEIDTPERLLRAATTALHAAQTAGRGRWVHHDKAMAAHDASRERLETALRDSLSAGLVDVAVQPVVDLGADPASDRTAGVEVLARWTRPDGTTVPAHHMAAIADDLGLGATLGGIVMDRALDLVASWSAAGDGDGDGGVRYVAVNLCRGQLEDPAFAQSVADRLSTRGLPAWRLSVEISAASFVDTEQARRTLAMLRSLGVGVTVDDFGRGSLGLVALRQLPVDTVKIDRQVTMDLGRDDTVAASVLSLCRAMGRRCIAEGVESTGQLEAARQLGMDGAQGFLLGRPMPPAQTPPRTIPSPGVTSG